MIDDAIIRLKNNLRASGISEDEIAILIREAQQEIDVQVRDLVADAVEQVQSVAENKEAWDFLDQIEINPNSGYVQIDTESGNLDFSTPPVPMLPWLLKNAKTSQTGNMYARIPIGKSSGVSVPVKDVSSGAASVRKGNSMADSAISIAQSFGMSATKIQKKIKDPSSVSNWVTVTSEQNKDTMWVKPAKDKDMRSEVDELNARLRRQIDEVCQSVVNKYER